MSERRFRVGTFYDRNKPTRSQQPLKSRVSVYTLWFNESWPGCIVYEIDAASPAEARAKARALRLEHEERVAQEGTVPRG